MKPAVRSPSSPRHQRSHLHSWLESQFDAADLPAWNALLQRFQSSRGRALWYFCPFWAYADVLPLLEQPESPDLCIFCDQQHGQPVAGMNMNWLTNHGFSKTQITAVSDVIPLRSKLPTSRYTGPTGHCSFRFEYAAYPAGSSRQCDALFLHLDWESVMDLAVIPHALPIEDLVLDYLPEIALLARRARTLGLQRIFSKLGEISNMQNQALKRLTEPHCLLSDYPRVVSFLTGNSPEKVAFEPTRHFSGSYDKRAILYERSGKLRRSFAEDSAAARLAGSC